MDPVESSAAQNEGGEPDDATSRTVLPSGRETSPAARPIRRPDDDSPDRPPPGGGGRPSPGSPPRGSAPAPVGGLRVMAEHEDSISLEFVDQSVDESGFTIVRRDTNDPSWTWRQVITMIRTRRSGDPPTNLGASTGQVFSYTDNSLPSAHSYCYRVMAGNQYGQSTPAEVLAFTSLPRPAPLRVVATGLDYIKLGWRPPVSGPSPESLMILERETSTGQHTVSLFRGWQTKDYAAQDSGLSPDTEYRYRISYADDRLPNGVVREWLHSDQVTARTKAQLPLSEQHVTVSLRAQPPREGVIFWIGRWPLMGNPSDPRSYLSGIQVPMQFMGTLYVHFAVPGTTTPKVSVLQGQAMPQSGIKTLYGTEQPILPVYFVAAATFTPQPSTLSDIWINLTYYG